MANPTNVIDLIYGRLGAMTPTDQKIAQVVLDEPVAVVNFTIAQLAHKAQVSEASVSRFCRNLQLTGFHQLKVEIARVATTETIATDTGSELLADITNNKVAEITHTLAQLQGTECQKIIHSLTTTPIVQVIAEGDTFPVAEDAVYKFNQIGIFTIAARPWETAVAQTLNMAEDGVVLAISNSGESKELLGLIKVAKDRHLQIIAITNRDDSPIAQQADLHLLTAVRQRVLQSEYYFSRVAAMTTIEALFLMMIDAQPERIERIRHHEGIIAGSKI